MEDRKQRGRDIFYLTSIIKYMGRKYEKTKSDHEGTSIAESSKVQETVEERHLSEASLGQVPKWQSDLEEANIVQSNRRVKKEVKRKLWGTMNAPI